jgi:Rha family phage regulatory protein
MYDLTIIKQKSGVYIDSREVADAIGKRHDNLLRDINRYREIITRSGLLKVEESDYFVESSYINAQNKHMPCFLLSKMGCELIAHKLIGEKGVLFTAAYVAKFNEMETAEREAEIKAHIRPRLSEFNSAVKNVLNGMSYAHAAPDNVMKFLRGVYEPLGIEVHPIHETDYYGYYTVTEIANMIGIYSSTGRPHAHAVSAIISKIENNAHHMMVVPYGLVGATFRYDNYILKAVRSWLSDNNWPCLVPYLGFDYHIFYARQMTLFEYDKNGLYKYT